MPYEIDDLSLRIIGYGVPIKFFDPTRTLRAEIYLQEDNTLNVGGIYGDSSEPSESIGAHALSDTNIHTGTLSNDMGPQFLLVDGTRALAGNMSVLAGVTIDGVDISAHAADADIHVDHTAVTLTAGDGLTGGGTIADNRTFAVGAGSGITVNADDVALTTPGTLTVASTNIAASSHTHAITTSTNPVETAAILATDSDGHLILHSAEIVDLLVDTLTVTVIDALGTMNASWTINSAQNPGVDASIILDHHTEVQAYFVWDGTKVSINRPLLVSGALTMDGTLNLGPGNKQVEAAGDLKLVSGAGSHVRIDDNFAAQIVYSATEPATTKTGMIWVET
jgi:hypothetical protein